MVHPDVFRFFCSHMALCSANHLGVNRNEWEATLSERDAFTLRLKPDLLDFVKEAAEQENRSVPNFVETVLIAEKRRRENKFSVSSEG